MSRINSNSGNLLESPRARLSAVDFGTQKGGQLLLAGFSLTINPGEMVAVIGSPALGEALVNLLAGLAEPVAGQVEIEGRDLAEMSPQQRAWLRREKIGVVTPSHNLMDALTVAENIALVYELSGIGHQEALLRSGVLLASVRATEIADRYPDQLDRYQQQKVAVARAGMGGAKLILANDPTTQLEAEQKEKIFSLLETQVDQGSSCVLCTSDSELAKLADRTVLTPAAETVQRRRDNG